MLTSIFLYISFWMTDEERGSQTDNRIINEDKGSQIRKRIMNEERGLNTRKGITEADK